MRNSAANNFLIIRHSHKIMNVKARSVPRALVATAIIIAPVIALAAVGTWTIKASLSVARYTLAEAAVTGKVYVAGGSDGSMNSLPTEVYDPATDTWTPAASVGPNVGGAQMYSVSGKLYYVGGFQPFQGFSLAPSNQLRIFDPLTGTWTNGVPMPVPRAFYAGGVINGKIYVTAGEQDGGGGSRPPDLDIYDPTTGTWAVGTPDPNPRRSSASTALNGKLYIIGGDTGGSPTNSVDVYDATTNTWGTETSLPVTINHATAQASNGKIYVVGGLVNGTTQSTTTYVLDSVTHTWGVEAGLNQPRSQLGSAILNGVIYATGGNSSSGLSNAHEAFITPVPPPTCKDQCKDDGWKNFNNPPFKNQGQCIKYVNEHSPPDSCNSLL
jgi:N-acetylneuraminic acid mutarotase